MTSTWGAGFEGGYTVTNRSTHTVSSWTITFTLPATEAVTSSWNGTLTHSGAQYTITSPPGRLRSPPATPRPSSAWTSATAARSSRRTPV
ncbi:cellulose binding domain-containing protein [Streptomyces sp. N50]|uniref:cellulose binding domain-containing protein n=1 Tax=Streptomyces sp. N50 TaxID=3081765 RepID=UPI0029621B41|nr:cellulose binding domain-containing protein [Streptomyces sp. N50]WOX17163.1 cellulose binding domain-containing protein [Streptomyces sp. N50]